MEVCDVKRIDQGMMAWVHQMLAAVTVEVWSSGSRIDRAEQAVLDPQGSESHQRARKVGQVRHAKSYQRDSHRSGPYLQDWRIDRAALQAQIPRDCSPLTYPEAP